jgi:hypothetical protein
VREARAGVVGWGLVGCGDIAAKRVASALAEAAGSALVTVARARASLAAEFAERHGARRWHADWRDVLKDAEVDAVYLATPVHLHAEQAVAASPGSTSCARSRSPSTSPRASAWWRRPGLTACGWASRTTGTTTP